MFVFSKRLNYAKRQEMYKQNFNRTNTLPQVSLSTRDLRVENHLVLFKSTLSKLKVKVQT